MNNFCTDTILPDVPSEISEHVVIVEIGLIQGHLLAGAVSSLWIIIPGNWQHHVEINQMIGCRDTKMVKTVIAENYALKIEGLKHRRFFNSEVTISTANDNLIGIVTNI
jgi:hypothetical protein